MLSGDINLSIFFHLGRVVGPAGSAGCSRSSSHQRRFPALPEGPLGAPRPEGLFQDFHLDGQTRNTKKEGVLEAS